VIGVALHPIRFGGDRYWQAARVALTVVSDPSLTLVSMLVDRLPSRLWKAGNHYLSTRLHFCIGRHPDGRQSVPSSGKGGSSHMATIQRGFGVTTSPPEA
jgi:hypothetical protein